MRATYGTCQEAELRYRRSSGAALRHLAEGIWRYHVVDETTGYMVDVHTCDKADSGTDSTIQMKLIIRDAEGNARSLGPWTQDGPQNDHENNQWDRYFFLEATRASRIDALYLLSDGAGDNPGWCWDRFYVTRIENGQPTWIWKWEQESPWIFGGVWGPFAPTSNQRP
jgi:hypothetical protein